MINKIILVFLFVLLVGCAYGDKGIQVMVCLDGDEIANLREYCLASNDVYDPEACRQVQVNLTCEDPSTGSVGVLIVSNK